MNLMLEKVFLFPEKSKQIRMKIHRFSFVFVNSRVIEYQDDLDRLNNEQHRTFSYILGHESKEQMYLLMTLTSDDEQENYQSDAMIKHFPQFRLEK